MVGFDFLRDHREKALYEPYMDRLRTIALLATRPDFPQHERQLVFDTIGFHTKRFAVDILSHDRISVDTLNTFSRAMDIIDRQLGVTEDDMNQAHKKQRDTANGFWEMSKAISQFPDTAEAALNDGVTHVIAAAMSGCVIGEYIGLLMLKKYRHNVPVDHMIFSRHDKDPVSGMLKPNFRLRGNHVLIVEDMVAEADLDVMVNALKQIKPGMQMSLTSLDFDPSIDERYLQQFAHVYPYIT